MRRGPARACTARRGPAQRPACAGRCAAKHTCACHMHVTQHAPGTAPACCCRHAGAFPLECVYASAVVVGLLWPDLAIGRASAFPDTCFEVSGELCYSAMPRLQAAHLAMQRSIELPCAPCCSCTRRAPSPALQFLRHCGSRCCEACGASYGARAAHSAVGQDALVACVTCPSTCCRQGLGMGRVGPHPIAWLVGRCIRYGQLRPAVHPAFVHCY